MTSANARTPRPRPGRVGLVLSAALVTAVSLLGGAGLLPSAATTGPPRDGVRLSGVEVAVPDSPAPTSRAGEPAATPLVAPPVTSPTRVDGDMVLPADSGSGRRVVFSEGRQRVWLVADRRRVTSTYLVSGSRYDNLDPGTYEVYSRSEQASAFDGSGEMRLFVRFTQGDTGAAIGFHTIPQSDGVPAQGAAELGTPQSHGCIRQRLSDARRMWRFAPLGTTVVVTA